MAYNNIYPIQLLNDIHNVYPDILYNPSRFRTVQDLLDYIRSGADINPYTRGLSVYNSRSTSSSTPVRGAGTRITEVSSPTVVSIHEFNIDSSTDVTPATSIRASIPLTIPTSGTSGITYTNPIGANILSALFGLTTGSGSLDSFLNQSVTVRPTHAQINNTTSISITEQVYEDNCVICQDTINLGDYIRKINHCGHLFHKDCIDTWFMTNVRCPTCRYDIRTSDTATSS